MTAIDATPVEATPVSARQAHSDALAAAAAAKAHADTLLARAPHDPSVTGADLAAACGDAEIAALRVPPAEAAVFQEQEQERREANALAADEYLEAEGPVLAEFAAAASAALAAFERMVAVARRHDVNVMIATQAAEDLGRPFTDDRLRRSTDGQHGYIMIDNRRLPPRMTLVPWMRRLANESLGNPLDHDPSMFPKVEDV